MKTINKHVDFGLFLVRLALGVVFAMHGWQKLSVMGLSGVAGFLTTLGIPFPTVSAALLIAAEFGGGLLMLAGLLSRPVGLILAFNMVVAASTVHLRNGFFLPSGFEFTFVLFLASLAIAAAGAGRYSVDALFGRGVVTEEIPVSRGRVAA
jgi:putative oxidoreductase